MPDPRRRTAEDGSSCPANPGRYDRGMTMQPRFTLAHFENAASRVMQTFTDACDLRDARTISSLVSPRFEAIDRRRDVSAGIDAPSGTISFLDAAMSQEPVPVVATRANRLALVRTSRRVGDEEDDVLVVVEIDENGLLSTTVTFVLGDLDLAMAELDARFTSGEAAPYVPVWNALRRGRQAIRRQDWPSLVELTADDAKIHDHRPLRSREVYTVHDSIEDFRAVYAMSPDAKVLMRHVVGICSRGCLMVGEWRGTMSTMGGGVFELLTATVIEVAPDGRIIRTDHHDLDQMEAARARYAALA